MSTFHIFIILVQVFMFPLKRTKRGKYSGTICVYRIVCVIRVFKNLQIPLCINIPYLVSRLSPNRVILFTIMYNIINIS